MIKVICTSVDRLPAQLGESERAFTYLYGPDTWWTHVRGHGGHIIACHPGC